MVRRSCSHRLSTDTVLRRTLGDVGGEKSAGDARSLYFGLSWTPGRGQKLKGSHGAGPRGVDWPPGTAVATCRHHRNHIPNVVHVGVDLM